MLATQEKQAGHAALKCLRACLGIALLVLAGSLATAICAQAPTGRIEGTVTDSSGGVLPGVKVTVTQKARGRTFTTISDSGGNYAVAALEPADYTIEFEVAHFKTGILNVRVEVGKVTPGNISLEVGEVEETVRVSASEETQMDTTRGTITGIITAPQLENLPTNGRNFLDLASLEPGIQVVDAASLELTKTGFTAVSIAGSEGRTTRIQVDGIDITDEVVGTTTQNFSLDAIQGFQISEFTLDPSTSLSNTGAINIVTRSGSDELHGSAYAFWRDHNFASTILGVDAPFHRIQAGLRAGGPIVRDKVFWFLSYEQTGQHNAVFLFPTAPFDTAFTGFVASPFPEHLGTGRLDWNATPRTHVFARFTHDDNDGLTGFGGNVLSPVENKNNTNSIATGADITLNEFTHSFRYGRMNFADYVNPAQLPGFQNFPLQIVFDDTGVTFGPNFLSRQHSLQTNDQFRYDGTFLTHGHVLQYGMNYSHISANLFGAPFAIAPEADTFTAALAGPNPADPLEYAPQAIIFGNGLGSLSNQPSRGFPFGGIHNNRIAAYINDTYRTARDITLNFGLRWEVDPGQVNNDLVRPTILDTVIPGQSGRVPVDEDNFGPTFGFAWNIGGRDTTVIRGGAGMYYETNIFENVLFDRAAQLPAEIAPRVSALFNLPGQRQLFGPSCDLLFDGSLAGNAAFFLPLGASVSSILSANATLQAETLAAQAGPPSGNIALAPSPCTLPGTQNTIGPLFERHFTQPYSIHSNIGLQQKIRRNWMLQADYVRNRGVHIYLVQDYNRFGAATTLNVQNAAEAIFLTEEQFGAMDVNGAIANGATIFNFAENGLDRGFAFPGRNPNFGMLQMIGTQGLSLYQGLLVKLTGRTEDFARVIHSASWEFSYALSRFDATQSDQANSLHAHALNNDCVTCLYGPAPGDRTHQFSFNSLIALPHGFHWNSVTHVGSPVAVTLQLPQTAPFGSGEIFLSDINGDGIGGDVLPGTNLGAFGRSISSVSSLDAAIRNFNQNFSGQLTPAGQALVNAGLFTTQQLVELNGVIQPLIRAPNDQVMLDWFSTTDFRFSKSFGVRERFQFEPSLDIFNVFNRTNFDPPGSPLSGILSGAAGTVNGTSPGQRKNVFGLGTGSFSPGIPRSLQFGLRISF